MGFSMTLVTSQALLDSGYPEVAKFLPGIIGLAKKLSAQYGKAEEHEDFVQVAITSACHMESKYNKNHEATFYTYVNKPIKSAIQNAFGNPYRGTSIYKSIQKYVEFHLKETSFYPTIDEITKGTGQSRSNILSIYYDRYNQETLTDSHLSIPEEVSEYSEWVEICNKYERKLIDLVIVDELTIGEAAGIMRLSQKEAKDMLEVALSKVKGALDGSSN